MKIPTTNSRKQGFSLVELLLTLVLILCLAAASVFTFTAVYQSANLDEGSDRFQSLIRFAQAEAATTGRKVRLQFVSLDSAPMDSAEELRAIKVTWEADLLNAPGVFQEYTNKAWSEEIVNELVGVTKVAAISGSGLAMPMESAARIPNEMGEFSETTEFPPITFYPDGSCDTAEVVLASRNTDDERRLAVRLGGILGTVTTRTVSSTEAGSTDPNAAEAGYDEFDDYFEPSSQSGASEFVSSAPEASYSK